MDIDSFEWWYSEGEDQDADDGFEASSRSSSFARLWDEAEDAEAEDAATATLGQPADMSISPAATPRPAHHIDPDETASFSILDVPAEGARAPAPASRPRLAREMDPRRRSPVGPIIVAFLAGVVACAGIGGVWYHLQQQQETLAASEMSLERSLNRTRSVHLSISVEGGTWDTTRGDSQMLIHVAGRTLKGEQVDEYQYVESDGLGIELRPGDYELTVAETPVATDGTRFRASQTMVPVSFNSRSGDTVDSSPSGTFDLRAYDV